MNIVQYDILEKIVEQSNGVNNIWISTKENRDNIAKSLEISSIYVCINIKKLIKINRLQPQSRGVYKINLNF